MAGYFYRSGMLASMVGVIVGTMGITTPSYARSDQTTVPSIYGNDGNVILISYSAVDRGFDFPAGVYDTEPAAAVHRDAFPAYRAAPASRPHRAGGAVLATTQAGWRSGRLRRLSG